MNFGYGIKFKYEGILKHFFDRFHVVAKFILPIIEDIEFLLISFDSHCSNLDVYLHKNEYPVQHLPNIRNFCSKIVPFVYYYKKQIDSYNKTVNNILMK